MTEICAGCGFEFASGTLYPIQRKYYCYPCALRIIRVNIRYLDRIERLKKQKMPSREEPFPDKQLADDLFELAQMIKKTKYIDGKLDMLLQNYNVFHPKPRSKIMLKPEDYLYPGWQSRVLDGLKGGKEDSEILERLGVQAGGHSYYETWVGHRAAKLVRYMKFQERCKKLFSEYLERLNQEANRAEEHSVEICLISRCVERTSKFISLWTRVNQTLGVRQIQALFAACLISDVETPISQHSVAEGSQSLYPHMNRSTVTTWLDRLNQFECRARNWRRSRMPEFRHEPEPFDLALDIEKEA